MKSMKRLKQSLRDIENRRDKIPLDSWLATQPWSVKRAVRSGKFVLPPNVTR